MNIYITTHHNVQNYGAALQAYALQQALMDLGYDSKLINYRNPKRKIHNKLLSASTILKQIIFFYSRINKKNILLGKQRFNDFFKNYHKTTREYINFEDLCNNPPDADVYLSGSDQVFNTITMSPLFFLQFGKKNIKRISYAASVGVSCVTDDKKELLKKYLSFFDSISIRENDSKELISRYTEKDINVNIDPSFLVTKEYWERLSSDEVAKSIKEPYVLVYAIYKPKWLNKVLKKIKRETGYKIVVMSYGNYRPVFCDKCVIDAGPREFLGLVKNAQMVISSSFHGNVFATIFEKPFYAVVNPGAPARIKSLLELLGLEDRVLTEETDINLNIEYSAVNEKIKIENERAKNYLVSAIEGIKDEHRNN